MFAVSIPYAIGQGLGVLAVILGFISYQMKTSRTVLAFQISVCFVFSLHYLLIGAMSGFVLNVVCLVRNVTFFFRDRGFLKSPLVTVFFTVLMGVLGALSWQGFPSVFVIVGMMVNTVGMAFTDPQNMRKSILISSPLVILYDVLVSSYGGTVYESVVIISSIVGIVRAEKGKRTEKKEEQM